MRKLLLKNSDIFSRNFKYATFALGYEYKFFKYHGHVQRMFGELRVQITT